MTSSNRHWPSMFRSNPACHFQQLDMNNSSLLSSPGSGNKPSLISSDESPRNPEPKPRWNPRPEQIRILEGIFNSGMVNPPRDEIRRIRLQLQEYGQVGDANVFYWFQNRKSRTKNKLRAAGQLQPAGRATPARACASSPAPPAPVTPPRHLLASPLAPTSSSSSSSDRSSGSSKSVKPAALASAAVAAASLGMLATTAINLFSPAPPPPLSAYQLYYHIPPISAPATAPPVLELVSPEPPILQQWPQSQYLPATELGGILGGSHAHAPAMYPAASVSPGVLLSLCNEALLGQEIVDMSCSKGIGQSYFNTTEPINSKTDALSAVIREDERARLQGLLHYGLGVSAAAADDAVAVSAPLAAPVQHAAAAAGDVSTVVLPSAGQSNSGTSAAVNDQLQGLLDAGLMGGAPAPPTATVVAVAARDAAVMCAGATAQCYSVPAMMHLDVKLFGQAAVLLGHSGEPVLLDDSGFTVEPLQQGALYYVLLAN